MYNSRAAALFCVQVVLWTVDTSAWKLFEKPTSTPPPTTPNFGKPARDVVADGSDNGSDSTLTRLVGNDVKTKPYEPILYEGQNGGPIKTSDELECKSGQVCCWANSDKSSLTTMKWKSGRGPTDPAKLQTNFDSQKSPDENYLVAYTDTKRGPADRALFESCSIACADGNVEVTFRYWTTPGVYLQLCTRDAFFGNTDKLTNCRNVQINNKQSGQAKVVLPGGQFITVDLIASSFTNDVGGVAIVDRINVSFKTCPVGGGLGPSTQNPTQVPTTPVAPTVITTTPTPAPRLSTAAVSGNSDDDQSTNCPALQCNFDQDTMCGLREYRLIRASGTNPTKGFSVRRGRFENLLTGVVDFKDSGGYIGAYLYPQDSVSLQSNALKISSPRVLRLQGYIAAQGLRLKVCLDNEANCPLITSSDVRITDRKRWKYYSLILPKGTKQLFIVAENIGSNQGAVGVDRIELLRPLQTGPLDAEQTDGSACSSISLRKNVVKQ